MKCISQQNMKVTWSGVGEILPNVLASLGLLWTPLEFPHSHYCEKTHWALDYKGRPFETVAIMPGFHLITVRKYAPDTSVPVLLDNSEVVQGSSEIITLHRKEASFTSFAPH